jgi:hypothetical protein
VIVRVGVAVSEGVDVGVNVGPPGVIVSVGVGDGVGVTVGVGVGVKVGPPGVMVAVGVGVEVGVGVIVGVGVGVKVGPPGVMVGVGVGVGPPTMKHAENSDVEPGIGCPWAERRRAPAGMGRGPRFVAVAVTAWPGDTVPVKAKSNARFPLPSVTSENPCRNVWPSPFPDGSHVALAKNSTRTEEFGVVFRVPWIVVLPPPETTDVITGKFWRSFAPVSPSPASLAVTPLLPRSIPSPPLEKIELPEIWF